MIDYCSRDGCQTYTISRSVDSRPLLKSWYCSAVCRDLATRPIHWLPDTSHAYVSCGGISPDDKPHLATPHRALVTCENCKRTGQWKQAEAA